MVAQNTLHTCELKKAIYTYTYVPVRSSYMRIPRDQKSTALCNSNHSWSILKPCMVRLIQTVCAVVGYNCSVKFMYRISAVRDLF